MPPIAPPERPLLAAATWDAPFAGVAELEIVLEMVRVLLIVLPLSAAGVPGDGGGVTDAFAEVAEVAEEVSDKLELVAELEVEEDVVEDDV